jgi:peptidyl-prolyl cis-trans isomerase SurA
MEESNSLQNVLNDMVESKLIIQKAKKLEYFVDQDRIIAMVDQRMAEIQKQFETTLEFNRWLSENNWTRSDIKEYFSDTFKEQYLKEQIIQKEIMSKAEISDPELEEYFEQNKDKLPMRPDMVELGMIMRTIKASEKTKEAKLKDINRVIDLLADGADFAELAKIESEGPSGVNGGDLGFFGKGMMVKPFEDVAFDLQPGEVSGVVETRFGYHVIKLDEKKDDEVKCSHILKIVEPSKLDSVATIELMNNVYQKLTDGEDFGELARTYSEDDSSAVNSGSIGEYPEEEFPELFKEDLSKIEVGQFTEVVQNGDILYVFAKLRDVPSREYDYADIKDILRKQAKNEKMQKMLDDFVDDIKDEIFVELNL